jgi:hypothetical protein
VYITLLCERSGNGGKRWKKRTLTRNKRRIRRQKRMVNRKEEKEEQIKVKLSL